MRLYIGNLNYKTLPDTLRKFFSPRTVGEVKIALDRETGRPRGFAFVEIPDADEARTALELNDCELDGRRLKINEAHAKEKGGGGSRGGGDRRDNGNGDRRSAHGRDVDWNDRD